MFCFFRKTCLAWFLVLLWLLPSLPPLSADGPRSKSDRVGRSASSKGDFVLSSVPSGTTPASAAASLPNQGRILAVVVGVGAFQSPSIRHLRYPAKDARDFAAWLRSVGVAHADIALITDKQATFKIVNKAITSWLRTRSTSRFDSVILFFSGHGLKDGQLYWLLHDSETDNLDASALRRDLLQKNLDRLRVKNKLLFVDACYSRASSSDSVAQKTPLLPREASQGFGGQGSFSLFSSDGNQESLEPAELQNGLFTHWLLRGLKGEADTSNDGVLTATELYAFVAAKVREASARYGKPQDPAQDDQTSGGQLVLLRLHPTVPTPRPTSLPNEAKLGTLRLQANLPRVKVYLDEAYRFYLPHAGEERLLRLPPGRYGLRFDASGYPSRFETVHIEQGETLPLEISFARNVFPTPLRSNAVRISNSRDPQGRWPEDINKNCRTFLDSCYKGCVDGPKTLGESEIRHIAGCKDACWKRRLELEDARLLCKVRP